MTLVTTTSTLRHGNAAGALGETTGKCDSQLQEIVRLVRGELTQQQRATLGSLVVMDVHARDVAAELVAQGITTVTDFAWQSQLRMYWEVRHIPRMASDFACTRVFLRTALQMSPMLCLALCIYVCLFICKCVL